MNKLNNLKQLKELYEELGDNKNRKAVKAVIDSAEWFQGTATEDSQNFNSYVDGCREELDYLIGTEDIEETLVLCDLYTQYFGNYVSDEFRPLRPVFEAIVDSHLAMICDYGI